MSYNCDIVETILYGIMRTIFDKEKAGGCIELDDLSNLIGGYSMVWRYLTGEDIHIESNFQTYIDRQYKSDKDWGHNWRDILKYYGCDDWSALALFKKYWIDFADIYYSKKIDLDMLPQSICASKQILTSKSDVLGKCGWLFDLLEEYRHRLAVIIGTKSLTKLYRFIDGCLLAFEDISGFNVPFDFLFNRFIETKFSDGVSCNWPKKLLYYGRTEERSCDMFFELVDEFKKCNV